MRRATGPATTGLSLSGRRNCDKLVAQLGQDGRKTPIRRGIGGTQGLSCAPGLEHDIDRPVRQMEAPARQFLADRGGEHVV